jgi:predicted metal-dependent hydrolase
MKYISIDGVSFYYEIKRTTKKKIYIRVKDGIVKVSATKNITLKEVKELFAKHIDFIKEQLILTKKEDVIHVNGTPYKPRYFVSDKNKVMIIGDEIYLYSKDDSLEKYKKILYDFYKKEVEKEVEKLISEAKKDFSEIAFPTISVRFMKSMFGNYHKVKHHVKLSSILAKYDYKYIKFILYHELSHVVEFNHTKKFFAYYEAKYPNAISVRKVFKKIKYNDCL